MEQLRGAFIRYDPTHLLRNVRVRYALPMRCPVLTWRMQLDRAMSGTVIVYAEGWSDARY
eukprot:3941503-Rhodomonas_salina.4